MLPFTRDQFFAVFAAYNGDVWPASMAAYLLALVVIAMLPRPSPALSLVAGTVLGAMWVWTGVAYHWLHFSVINQAAWVFGALFVAQGIALFTAGTGGRMPFARRDGAAIWIGGFLIAYAMLLYPLIGIWSGHRPVELPMFGITPCPLTLFTFGVLLWARPPVPWWLLAVPLAWSLVGGSAAFLLQVRQDWLLPVAGIVVSAWLLRERLHRGAPSQPRRAVG